LATPRKKRGRWRTGDLVRIDLGQGYCSYGRVLDDACVAFYDSRSKVELKPEIILARPILFQTGVMKYALTSGRWQVLGNFHLDPSLAKPRKFFIQDPLNGSFSIYRGGRIKPATRSECRGLECCAVWEPEHAEDRLRDHYAGRKNKWVESMLPRH